MQVTIVAGKGGVGKSTSSAALAVSTARSRIRPKTAIIDYDGGGITSGGSGTVNKNYMDFYDGTSRYRQYSP